ncbi:MAG TPA: hypothetical protein VHB77_22745 [Planctomycetaceae bacterium]|nr:hypothetical protein [Planctomycetaceae bacterium]
MAAASLAEEPRHSASHAQSSGTATAAPPECEAEGCPQCGDTRPWGLASWCPRCGYYPAIGRCIDVKPEDESVDPTAAPPLWTLIPAWGWILAGGVIAIAAVSLVGRLITPPNSWARTNWAVAELMIGAGLLLGGHGWSFMVTVMKSAQAGLLDFLLKPITIWSVTFQQLPRSARRVWLGGWGLATMLCAMTIVGGLRYSAIFDDWGFRKPAEKNLAKAVMEKALANKRREEGTEGIDKATKDFAGEAGKIDPMDDSQLTEQIDCVVFGYRPHEKTIDLLLAAVVQQELRYVGTVSRGITPETREQMLQRLETLGREKPFIKCDEEATWVEPLVSCRIKFKNWSDAGRLFWPKFDSMLADVKE